MWKSAIVAYLHYLGLMLSFGSLIVEYFFFKKDLNVKDAKIVGIADGIYGISATTILVTGILRVMYFGKGAEYYLHNQFFWVKITLFIIVGLLSLYPTITFIIWWVKDLVKEQTPTISDNQYQIISLSIKGELIGFTLIPLMAAIMARIS